MCPASRLPLAGALLQTLAVVVTHTCTLHHTQMQEEALYCYYVSRLPLANASIQDAGWRRRVVARAGRQLCSAQPAAAQGKCVYDLCTRLLPSCTHVHFVMEGAHAFCGGCTAVVLHMQRIASAAHTCAHNPGLFDAAAEHYTFAVNAAIVDNQFATPDGAVHLAAAGIKPVQLEPRAPPPLQVGCMLLF